MGHDSLLPGQAAISRRNNQMLSWWPITGGGSASYLITAARLSLLRDPGEDGPLLSGDLTACGVLGTSFSRIMLHPVPSQIITEGVSTAKPDSSLLSLVLAHSNRPFGKKIMDGDIEYVSYQVWVKTRPKCLDVVSTTEQGNKRILSNTKICGKTRENWKAMTECGVWWPLLLHNQ